MSADPPGADAGAPPGWYTTAYGWQWWDGRQWYPPAPVPARGSDEKTLAVLSHFGPFLGGFLLPLVLFLTAKDKPFVRHHACEALNLAILETVLSVLGSAVFFLTFGIGGAFGENDDLGAGWIASFLVTFGLLGIVSIVGIVFAIMGAVKASRMEWWRYPVNLRLVKP